ncbi:hypothetical protein JCM6882_002491 [Rhodosporidiobolus microsporus]
MSTRDDLVPATRNLSLSSSTTAFTAPFTLVSADGHVLELDSALPLAGTSTIFADMLGSGSDERSCVLSESKEEVEEYLKAVREGKCGSGHAVALFKMADKYDAPVVHAALARAAWNELPHSPWFAYAVGCKLEEKGMMQVAAEASLVFSFYDGLSPLFDSLDQEDKNRLRQYRQAVVEKARCCIKNVKLPRLDCSHDGLSEAAYFLWHRARRAALNAFGLPVQPDDLMQKELRRLDSHRPDCAPCSVALEDAVQKVKVVWESEKDGWRAVKLEC